MKVVHVFWSLTYGGIETMLVNIANSQVAAGADVSVIIINDLWENALIEAFDKGVRVRLVHRKIGTKWPWFLLRLNKMLREEHEDVIHLHGSGFIDMLMSRSLKRKACATLHDMPQGRIRSAKWLRRAFPLLAIAERGNVKSIDRVPRVFAISEAVHDALLEKYGVESRVVSNGIITSAFRQRGERPAGKPLRIVQVSRLVHEKKGQDLLIEAVAALKGKASVDFIGVGESMDFLKYLSHKLGAEQWVRFLGKKSQDEVKQMLADYDLFAQPSRFEGFGLTVAEAMAAGVPALVSAGEGPAEVTQGDLYGWTFDNGNTKSLIDAITHIADNYDAALRKAQEARKHVVDTYDVSVTARNYLEEYKAFIGG